MRCQNCGAEIKGGTNFCEFCGSQVTIEMRKEQEQINKAGCPKCRSTNITFNREKQGEVKGKNRTAVVRTTVGVCKDCGYTWNAEVNAQPQKKSNTWLWVLGWILIFPVPLTILLLRPTNKMDKKIKYGIIAAVWIAFFLIGITGNNSDNNSNTKDTSSVNAAVSETIKETEAETTTAESVTVTQAATSAKESNDSMVSEEKSSANGVDPDLKAFLDSYETYMDEYCEFMENYDASDANMMMEYSEMLTKYADFAEKADAYETETMSAADNEYYLEVMTRVNEKLLQVAYSQ